MANDNSTKKKGIVSQSIEDFNNNVPLYEGCPEGELGIKNVNKVRALVYFFWQMNADRIGIYTAQASFFLVLSIFPIIILFLELLVFMNMDHHVLIEFVNTYLPDVVRPLMESIITDIFSNVSQTTVWVMSIMSVWASSKGVVSVLFGLYKMYDVHQNRNYFVARTISIFYTIIFVLSLALTMIILIFGNNILNVIIRYLPVLKYVSSLTLIIRYLSVFIMLTIIFVFIFRIANLSGSTAKKVLPGAIFASIGWIVFSSFFSLFVDNFSKMNYMYGSLTAFIVLMLWIYFCVYILFIGAEINKLIYPELSDNTKSVREHLDDISEKLFKKRREAENEETSEDSDITEES